MARLHFQNTHVHVAGHVSHDHDATATYEHSGEAFYLLFLQSSLRGGVTHVVFVDLSPWLLFSLPKSDRFSSARAQANRCVAHNWIKLQKMTVGLLSTGKHAPASFQLASMLV